MSILKNKLRNGNFNSSEIVALTKEPTAAAKKEGKVFGVAGITFIEETNYERRLGRSISDESNAKPLTWGKILESRAFNLLGMEYSITSQETDVHPFIDYWVGSKDGIKYDEGKTVIDFKCPLTLGSFCKLVQPLYDGLTGMDAMNAIRDAHKDGDKFYWQLVSNACINDCRFAELIVYMPYESELSDIKLEVEGLPNCYWIAMAGENELPFINNEGYYKNINIIRFEVPQEDKDFLTERVKKAGTMLIDYTTLIVATGNEDLKATIIEPQTISLQKLQTA